MYLERCRCTVSGALNEIIESVRDREKTLTVHAPAGKTALVEELREFLDAQNVTVEHREIEATEPAHAVLHEGDRFLAVVGVGAIYPLLDPGLSDSAIDDPPPYAPLLDHLDGSTFTSYDRAQMREASREIEDRAWRLRTGRLYAGFQTFSTFAEQADVYRRLGDTDLDVHVYGRPDREPPSGPYEIHAVDDPEVARTWFVVFDADGNDAQKSALVAEEREAGTFYGFWTYEPAVVDDVVAAVDGLRR